MWEGTTLGILAVQLVLAVLVLVLPIQLRARRGVL
jgi:hypothetical protein